MPKPVRRKELSQVSISTPYQRFFSKWSKGCGNEICGGCRNVVLGRGHVPCDVLFVGQAPGKSEDVLGLPFIGPVGHLLQEIMAEAIPEGLASTLKITFTNMVGCIPLYGDPPVEEEPSHDDVMRCRERLQEFVEICQPRLVIAVGKIAKDFFCDPKYRERIRVPEGCVVETIQHPGAIIQANVIHQGLMRDRSVIALRDIFEDVFLKED